MVKICSNLNLKSNCKKRLTQTEACPRDDHVAANWKRQLLTEMHFILISVALKEDGGGWTRWDTDKMIESIYLDWPLRCVVVAWPAGWRN